MLPLNLNATLDLVRYVNPYGVLQYLGGVQGQIYRFIGCHVPWLLSVRHALVPISVFVSFSRVRFCCIIETESVRRIADLVMSREWLSEKIEILSRCIEKISTVELFSTRIRSFSDCRFSDVGGIRTDWFISKLLFMNRFVQYILSPIGTLERVVVIPRLSDGKKPILLSIRL